VTRFEKQVSEVIFMQKGISKFLGNRFVEVHIRGNAQATEIEPLEIDISFVYLP
jgi:hypothetical protein